MHQPKKTDNNRKRNTLFMLLNGVFLTNAIVAEIVGAKLFSLEALFGAEGAGLTILGQGPLDFTLTAGVILWPVVFITSDIINEYFGKSGVRKISFMTAALLGYVFVAIWAVTYLPASGLWLNAYPDYNINTAFADIFRQGLGIIVGSLVAFLIGQLLDVVAFQWLRGFTGGRMIWLRATGSTLISQFVDSFVVLFIAFYIFGPLNMAQVIAIGLVNYVYKFSIAILLTPLLYLAHYMIDAYLGKELSEQMTAEAARSRILG